MILSLCLAGTLLFTQVDDTCFAAKTHNEKYYQQHWCLSQQGQTEYRLDDDTRVDCLTKTHAVEFDFAKKWAESIGQSLHYSRLTNKTAGIVLIVKNHKDVKYVDHVSTIISHYGLPIKLWIVQGE